MPSYPRKRNIFDPTSTEPYKLSRSKLERFMQCPRCFYLDRRLGIDQPSSFPLSLNLAVDHLLKKEFDIHRVKQSAHPLMERYGVDAVPFEHTELARWRENFKGVQYLHAPTNLLITGAVDDIWVSPDEQLIVVDYKATARDGGIDPDSPLQDMYKRQLAIYQWLLRRNEFSVSDRAYLVYVNGQKDREAFDGKLEFDVMLIEHICDDSWVEDALMNAHACLMQGELPDAADTCEYCQYRMAAQKLETRHTQGTLW